MFKRFISTGLINLITHPLLLAFLAAILTLVLSPREFNKYQLEVLESGYRAELSRISVYQDLNDDGPPEKIQMRNLDTNANLVAYSEQKRILGTWNLPGYWYRVPGYEFINMDGDETEEILALSVDSEDSVWLSHFELDDTQEAKTDRFVCKLTRHNNSLDHNIRIAGLYDISGDSFPEFIFTISSGFSLQPRACYAWDIRMDTILRTPMAGINYQKIIALNSPGHGSRVFPAVVATQNYREAIPYSDTASYAVVLTRNLNYLFDPVYTGGGQSTTATVPFQWKNNDQILAITNHRRREIGQVTLRVLDQYGHTIAMNDSIDLYYSVIPIQHRGKVWLCETLERGFALYGIGPDLELEEIFRNHDHFAFATSKNLNSDSIPELLFIDNQEHRFGILEDDLKTFTAVDLPGKGSPVSSVSILSRESNQTTFFLQLQGSHYILNYALNSFYPFRSSFYLGIYLLYALAFIGMQKLFLFRNRQKKEMEEEIEKLQLQSVMNQLNPHFTFNAINSIGHGMMNGDSKEAYSYFAILSNLIRESMKNAFEPYKTLGEEVDFVRQYLRIESYRFGDKLSWNVELNPEVDKSIIIPKMLIHLFVENAVKHGIFHQPMGGEIEVLLANSNDGIDITVTDNGVGMQKSSEIVQKRGEGLNILNNYLFIFNKKQKHSVSYKIQDRNRLDENQSGTKVHIHIDFQGSR